MSVQRDSHVLIPDHLDFRSVPGLSNELVERLESARPETIDQASRIAGITPPRLRPSMSRRAGGRHERCFT